MKRLATVCVLLAVPVAVVGRGVPIRTLPKSWALNCGKGRELDFSSRHFDVKTWSLRGNCTLTGGRFTPGSTTEPCELRHRDGRLRIAQTSFTDVHIMVHNSVVELDDTFHEQDKVNPRKMKDPRNKITERSAIWERGGALEAVNSYISIKLSRFIRLDALDGGAIWLEGGRLEVNYATFHRARAAARGGAIFVRAALTQLDHVHFTRCTARLEVGQPRPQSRRLMLRKQKRSVMRLAAGGVIYMSDGRLEMSTCSVDTASAADVGGVVCATGFWPLVMMLGCNFENLEVGGSSVSHMYDEQSGLGGVLALFNGTALIGYTKVTNSHATRRGGVVWSGGAGVTINGSVIESASAMHGGAVYMEHHGVEILATTFVNVKALGTGPSGVNHGRGAMLCAVDAHVTMTKVIVQTARCQGDGGVVHQSGGQLHMLTVSLMDVEADGRGGGFFLTESRKSLFVMGRDIHIAKCFSGESGGGIFMHRNELGTVMLRKVAMIGVGSRHGSGGGYSFTKVRTVAVIDSVVLGTSAGKGGGSMAFSQVKAARVFNASFMGSLSAKDGGAIELHASDATFGRLQIREGHARFGGGIVLWGKSSMRLQESSVSTCVARVSGGAITAIEDSSVDAEGLSIKKVKAKEQGGAVYLKESRITFQDLETEDTEAGMAGGALFALNSRVEVVNASSGGEITPTWANIGRSPFVRLQNVSLLNLKLVGIVFGFWQSTVQFEGIYGVCPPRAEFTNKSSKLSCMLCAKNKGMLGFSEIGSNNRCMRCPEHAVGVKDKGCQCKSGYVLNNSVPGLFSALKGNLCVSCRKAKLQCGSEPGPPIALNCSSNDSNCRRARAIDGAWRARTTLQAPVDCPYWPACRSVGDTKCEEGYEGPLCMVCKKGRFRRGRYSPCRPCDVTTAGEFFFCSVIVLGLLAAVFVCVNFKKVRGWIHDWGELSESHTSYIRVKTKLVLFSLQTFSTLHQLRFPTVQAVQLTSVRLSVFSLDVFGSAHISICRLGLGSLGRYGLMLLQLVLIFTAILIFGAKTKVNMDGMLLLAYNFTLTNVVKESVGLFLCDSSVNLMTGTTYLLSDYSAACTGFEYRLFCAIAACVLATWCVGIPGFLFLRMYQRRHQLNPTVKPNLTCTDSSPEAQISAVVTQVNRSYKEALRCFGIATMLHVAKKAGVWRPGTLDCTSASLSWGEEDCAPSADHLKQVRRMSAGSAQRVTDSRHLLKRGLRAVEERRQPSLLAYRSFYRNYTPDRWYFEFISILGRTGYAVILLLPGTEQCLAGLMLSVVLLLSICLLMPFQRKSDTQVAAFCYVAMIGLFGAHTGGHRSFFLSFFCSVCLALPVLALLYHALLAYALPGRGEIWTLEAASSTFDEEFIRAKLAPRERRQRQHVELTALTSRLSASRDKEEEDAEDA